MRVHGKIQTEAPCFSPSPLLMRQLQKMLNSNNKITGAKVVAALACFPCGLLSSLYHTASAVAKLPAAIVFLPVQLACQVNKKARHRAAIAARHLSLYALSQHVYKAVWHLILIPAAPIMGSISPKALLACYQALGLYTPSRHSSKKIRVALDLARPEIVIKSTFSEKNGLSRNQAVTNETANDSQITVSTDDLQDLQKRKNPLPLDTLLDNDALPKLFNEQQTGHVLTSQAPPPPPPPPSHNAQPHRGLGGQSSANPSASSATVTAQATKTSTGLQGINVPSTQPHSAAAGLAPPPPPPPPPVFGAPPAQQHSSALPPPPSPIGALPPESLVFPTPPADALGLTSAPPPPPPPPPPPISTAPSAPPPPASAPNPAATAPAGGVSRNDLLSSITNVAGRTLKKVTVDDKKSRKVVVPRIDAASAVPANDPVEVSHEALLQAAMARIRPAMESPAKPTSGSPDVDDSAWDSPPPRSAVPKTAVPKPAPAPVTALPGSDFAVHVGTAPLLTVSSGATPVPPNPRKNLLATFNSVADETPKPAAVVTETADSNIDFVEPALVSSRPALKPIITDNIPNRARQAHATGGQTTAQGKGAIHHNANTTGKAGPGVKRVISKSLRDKIAARGGAAPGFAETTPPTDPNK